MACPEACVTAGSKVPSRVVAQQIEAEGTVAADGEIEPAVAVKVPRGKRVRVVDRSVGDRLGVASVGLLRDDAQVAREVVEHGEIGLAVAVEVHDGERVRAAGGTVRGRRRERAVAVVEESAHGAALGSDHEIGLAVAVEIGGRHGVEERREAAEVA